MNTTDTPVTPASPSERIVCLDVLRGFAILGILLMNIQSFAMIDAAYMNPSAYGDLSGVNRATWVLCHLFADQKFMTLFAILFGAGIVLMSDRAEARGRKATGLHYRRTVWLLLIGLVHAYLLWYGDVLVPYALCSLLAFFFRRLTPRKLFVVGLLLIAVSSAIFCFFGLTIEQWPSEARADIMQDWSPGPDKVEEVLSAYRGEWAAQMSHRVPTTFFFQTFVFAIWGGWRAGGLMLVGMALFKWGVLTGERSRRFYIRLMVAGFVIGLPIISIGMVRNFAAGWSLNYSMFLGGQFNYWGSLFISHAYIAGVMLICKHLSQTRLTALLAGVGRTALTNYLGQTLLCTFIFYGHGLGWFGYLQRWQQLLVVLGVWTLQLIATTVWLRFFRSGPMEWLWRSLTYWKIQPLLREKSVMSDQQFSSP